MKINNEILVEKMDEITALRKKSSEQTIQIIELEAMYTTEKDARINYMEQMIKLGYIFSSTGVPEIIPNGKADMLSKDLDNYRTQFQLLKEEYNKVLKIGKEGMDLVNLLEKRINSLGYDAVNVDEFGNPRLLSSTRVPRVRRRS